MNGRGSGDIILAALDEGDSAIVDLQPDPTGTFRIVEMNSTFSRMTNYTRQEALGTALSGLHAPSTDTTVQHDIDEAMRLGKSLRGEIEYISRVGRPFWFGFTLMPVVDPVTRCLHSVLLGRDITAKRKQDSEQSATQTLLASVFQKIDAAVVIVRSDGVPMLANTAWHALLGYGTDELSRIDLRQLASPAYADVVANAHARQFADGRQYKLAVELLHKNGTPIPVHMTSVKIERSDMQCFRVVTLSPVSVPPIPTTAPKTIPAAEKGTAVLGCIQFLGLDAIKDAYGSRWASVGERLMLAAEGILKRRLATGDVLSRTADQGFCIWFKEGSEEENAARVTRIGREMRIMLLGELGEDAHCSVSAYAQSANIEDPGAPRHSIMASLNRLMAERRLEAEQQAKEFLDRITQQQPNESTHLFDRSGRVIRSSFVDLPHDLRGRFAAAMSLLGGLGADIDTGLFRLALAAKVVLEDVVQGRDDIRLTAIPFGLFSTRQGRELFLEQWRSYPLSVGQQLLVMVSEVPPTVGHPRLAQIAELLRSVAKRTGVLLDDLDTLPLDRPAIPFNVVGLMSNSIAETPDAKLIAFIQKVHKVKARVLIRLSSAEPPQRWYSLGADLTAAF